MDVDPAPSTRPCHIVSCANLLLSSSFLTHPSPSQEMVVPIVGKTIQKEGFRWGANVGMDSERDKMGRVHLCLSIPSHSIMTPSSRRSVATNLHLYTYNIPPPPCLKCQLAYWDKGEEKGQQDQCEPNVTPSSFIKSEGFSTTPHPPWLHYGPPPPESARSCT